jgi:magnesium-transporting ATPase (P-type)
LKVNPLRGLTAADLPERREHFGSNEMKKPEAEGFWAKLWDALQDFMLKVLLCAGCFSIIVDMLVADPAGRKLGKFLLLINLTSPCIKIYVYSSVAWIEGTAILVAVFLVSGVGSFVDWRKEVAFLAVKLKQMEKNVVSPC